jgi:hypothetical protein
MRRRKRSWWNNPNTEHTSEFEHRSAAAVKSTSRDRQRVYARYRREVLKMKQSGRCFNKVNESARDSVHGKIARIESCWVPPGRSRRR